MMPDNRKLSALPLADGLTDEDMILVTQGGLSKRSTVGALQEGVLGAVAFQQEATEQEALAGTTSDTVMSARRVKAVADTLQATPDLMVVGREYLGAWLNALIAGAASINLDGDSTTLGAFGSGPTEYRPSGILEGLLDLWNIEGVTITNNGVGGSTTQDWLSTGIALSMSNTPDLMVICYGLNDIRNDVDLLGNLAAGLTTIRETRPVENLSIILRMPNTVLGAGDLLTPAWLESIRAPLRDLARKYQCAFVDTYKMWEDASAMMTIMYESPTPGQYIHPASALYAMEWSQIGALIFPEAFRHPPTALDLSGYVIKAGDTMTGNFTVLSAAQTTVAAKADTNIARFITESYVGSNLGSTLFLRKARGTVATPAMIANADQLGAIFFNAHTGSAFVTPATILAEVHDASFSATSMAARLTFNLAASGSNNRAELLRLEHATGITIFGTDVVIDKNKMHVDPGLTFANLPGSPTTGARVIVTDLSGTPTRGAPVAAGGGSTSWPCWYDGSNWIAV